jgi:mannose-6-phosphate isomerase-like protein (cupin superfamily)
MIHAIFSGMFDRNTEMQENAPGGDVVSELLMGMRLRGASYGKLRLSPPCGVSFEATDDARFHFVAAGNLLLESGTGETFTLGCGDAVLLPRGDAHALVSAPGVRPRPVESFDRMPLCSNVCAVTALKKEAAGRRTCWSSRAAWSSSSTHCTRWSG